MYKLLPILLFVFILTVSVIIAGQSKLSAKSAIVKDQTPLIIENNIPQIKDKFDYVNDSDWKLVGVGDMFLQFMFQDMVTEVEKILNPDTFVINLIYEICNTTQIGVINLDSLTNIVRNFETECFNPISFYKLSIDKEYYDIQVTRLKIDVNIDNSFQLTTSTRIMIEEIITGTLGVDREGCSDCIIINSVDIEKLKSKSYNKLSLNRDDIYDDSWAVIIGIDKYKYSDQLNYAVKDAEAVKEMLISKFDYPIENIRYLVDDEATLSEIKLALDDISTSADKDDRILVFYSGHGETQKNIDGTETGYIIPVEGRQDKPYATGLAMDEILRTCQMSNAKHMLFLMDACYSGLMTENVKGLSKPQEEGYLSKVANEKARQIITAGGRDEQVIERDEWQHSAFTKNLLAGLYDWEADTDDDGYVTADELGTYLRKSVTEDSDFQQTPQKGRFRNSGGGEFVFFSNHKANKPKLFDQTAKSNGDDIAAEKAVDMKKSWYEKYGHKEHGIGFMVFEDFLQIGYARYLNENWLYSIAYSHIGNNLINKIIIKEKSHTATTNNYIIGLIRIYYFTDNMYFHIGGHANYMTIFWKDIDQNISGNFNKIVPSAMLGIAVSPFQIENPFPMSLIVSFDINSIIIPKSYSETDGIIMFDDLQIKFLPGLIFHIGLPLSKK